MDRPKIIAVDFDGCLVTNKYPEIGEPIEKNIIKLKEEKKAGAKIILWTSRGGDYLDKAIIFCVEHGIDLDAVNANLPEMIKEFGSDTRKIFADEYWDDKAVLMSEKDICEFSDGYHTFRSLYNQRMVLFAVVVNSFPDRAWKSHKHSNGEDPFGGGWFVVGVSTPEGNYTYHYEDKYWDIFHCKELETAPEWDGHTDKDVERLLSLMPKSEEDSTADWASKEVEMAIRSEKEASEGTDDWKYGAMCYKSALRAFRSLTGDGHSGFSIQAAKSILNRLIDGRCLTPIEDEDYIWTEAYEKDGVKTYQCNRMSSLFKKVSKDGTVTYNDIDRVCGVNINNPDVTFTNGFLTRLVNKIFPITMPYLPLSKRFRVTCDEFLVDPKKGDYDTVGYLDILTPDGKIIELNRYFKDDGNKMVQIDKAEFEERKTKKVVKK